MVHFYLLSFELKLKPPKKPMTSFLLKCEWTFSVINALSNIIKRILELTQGIYRFKMVINWMLYKMNR